jgi:hypothetical protein
MRPKPPKIVSDWEQIIRTPPPMCCHTCYQYTHAGYCKTFQLEPPAEFTQEVGQCEAWEQEIPF